MISRRHPLRRKRQPSGSAGLLLVMLLYVSAHAAIDRLGPVPADVSRGHAGQFQDTNVRQLALQRLAAQQHRAFVPLAAASVAVR